MPINHNEIISEIQNHIRKVGGAFADWCVGTAKDPRSPFFESHRVAEKSDGLIYREAFTASGAQAAEPGLDSRVRGNDQRLRLHCASTSKTLPNPAASGVDPRASQIATITNRCKRHPRFKSPGRARPAPARRIPQRS